MYYHSLIVALKTGLLKYLKIAVSDFYDLSSKSDYDPTNTEIILDKNRDRKTGLVNLRYELDYSSLIEMAKS